MADSIDDPERVLRELERSAAYWERQAALQKVAVKNAAYLKRRDRCIQLASQIRKEAGIAAPGDSYGKEEI